MVISYACGIGLGAVLLQDGRPIAFEGKPMSLAEQNYRVEELELLAVRHALDLSLQIKGGGFTRGTTKLPTM